MDDDMNNLLDNISFVVVAGVVAEVLPTIALIFTIIWTGIRIYEWVLHRFIRNEPSKFK